MTTLSQRLRQKLLDLAIRGKLVPQDAHDEPADELLARIRKARSAQKGRARTPTAPLPVTDDEKPFDLPKGWTWCRLGEVCDVFAGYPFDGKKYAKAGIRICGGLIIMPDRIKWNECKYWANSDGLEEYLLKPEDVVVALDRPWISSGTKIGIIKEHDLPCLLIQRTARLRSDVLAARYLVTLLGGELFRQFCDPTGTTVPHISHKDIEAFPIPLPPLAEQKRIVAALDGMLAAADAVEAGTDKIATLKEKARAKILDLAIRGKLVKQDKRDGSADELLKQMREADICEVRPRKPGEKVPPERCIVGLPDHKLVSVRPKDSVEPVAEDEQYFEVPESWRWVRLRELGVFSGGHTPSLADPKFWDGGDILWVTSKDMKRKYITDTGKKVTKAGAEELGVLPVGTMLMVVRSGILRRTFPIAIAKEPLTINQDQRALQFYVPEVGEYVYAVLKGLEHIVLRDYRKTGTTVESIIWEKFINMPIPLPPLAEQKRIVARVDEMLAACDSLVGEV